MIPSLIKFNRKSVINLDCYLFTLSPCFAQSHVVVVVALLKCVNVHITHRHLIFNSKRIRLLTVRAHVESRGWEVHSDQAVQSCYV